MNTLRGIAVSPGAAVAPAYIHHATPTLALPDRAEGTPEEERARLLDALDAVADDLEEAAAGAAGDAAEILHAQAAMARDRALRAEASSETSRGAHAATAAVHAGGGFADQLAASGNPYLAARAVDVRHICDLAARRVLGLPPPAPPSPDVPSVIVADDLTPLDTARIDPQRVVGIVTAGGSPTSHTSIVARALGVPAVVAVHHLLDLITAGSVVGVDGSSGTVHVDPDPATVTALRETAEHQSGRRERARARAGSGPTLTRDGTHIEVAANIRSPEELHVALEEGAEGVGLLRTELLFVDQDRPPSVDEQTELLGVMQTLLGGRRLVVRTFDIGSDKHVPFLPVRPERNPELGVRGIRLARRHPELLETQLAAVAAVAARAPTAVMAPMVATVEEVDWFLARVREVAGDAPLEVGVMIEVPSAVLLAREIAERVDFVSIGTNDLGQYLHAADRRHPDLAGLQDPFEPSLLRAIDLVCRAGTGRCRVGVCGEAAADPAWACLAVGLGVTELSMQPTSIPFVRAALAESSHEECALAARKALEAIDASDVRKVAGTLVRPEGAP